ncbi:uncharacterized protein [Argopecten irradians]|uniref:uncharacterized protein n=1 Tax=Argopecten irradians TaxID=31199 RepID=UPI00371DA04C
MSKAVQSRLTRVFHVSVLTNFVLLAALVVLYIVRQTVNNRSPPDATAAPEIGAQTEIAGQICLPCDFRGKETVATLYEFVLKTEDNDTLCCLQSDDRLQEVILQLEDRNRYGRRPNQDERPLHWWTGRNFAAHLYANDIHPGQNVSWSLRDSSTSFLRNLTLSTDGRKLSVPAMAGAGMYFVYALYTFDFRTAATTVPAPTGVHNIYKDRPSIINSERKRLWTAKFGGDTTERRQTSFLCGIIHLNMYDTIETEAISFVPGQDCTTKYIDRSPYSNYFGMFKLLDLS